MVPIDRVMSSSYKLSIVIYLQQFGCNCECTADACSHQPICIELPCRIAALIVAFDIAPSP